jgi:hypothetical protein
MSGKPFGCAAWCRCPEIPPRDVAWCRVVHHVRRARRWRRVAAALPPRGAVVMQRARAEWGRKEEYSSSGGIFHVPLKFKENRKKKLIFLKV